MDLDHDACYRAISNRDPRFDGRLFVAVMTTGIYCRPICPARTPKRENVRFYPSAAAAQEAGFRPCLRCRPEIAPDVAAWRGTSNTVARALSLIEMGALDESDLHSLCGRLGVGERQLRRLFRRHVGAAPIAVAQARRVLLAKQLIHETRLPMVEVALAAGFGSIRRFNETFRELYGRAPSALRRAAPAARSKGELVILLPYRPPYDWHSMLSSLERRAIPGLESAANDCYSRTIEVDGVHGLVCVQPAKGNALRVSIRCPKLPALPKIIARVRRVFDLAADPQTIGAHLAEDPALAPLVAARPGLRVPGAWDGFESAVRAVLSQASGADAVRRVATEVVATLGEPLRVATGGLQDLALVFPQPARLAAADLASLGVPKRQAVALTSLAAAVAADPQIFGPKRSLDEATGQLRALAGIGESTAQYIAMSELREPDAFPAGDIELQRALTDENGRVPSAAQLLARAARWRPWRAYAAQHLWVACAAEPARAGARSARREHSERIQAARTG